MRKKADAQLSSMSTSIRVLSCSLKLWIGTRLMSSYVDRDKAIDTGLAFWTDDGTPGIQVSPPLSPLFLHFSLVKNDFPG